ncbi:hypothetical protein L7F22_050481 [Adiantum nelumboides]|nr:hypothetical protein [Adiantum nelumboides]
MDIRANLLPVFHEALSLIQGCRCGFAPTSTPFCIHLEKFQLVAKSQPSYIGYGQGKSTHFPGVVLAQSTQTPFATLEKVETAESAGWSVVSRESASIQLQQNEQPLLIVEAAPVFQNTSFTVETFNDPSLVTTGDVTGGDTLLSDASLSQPAIMSSDIAMPSAEESISAAAIASGAASESSQEVTTTAMDSLPTDQYKSAKEAYEAMLSGAGDSTEQGSSIDALTQTSQSLSDGFTETKSAIVKEFLKLQGSIQDSLDSTKMSFKSTYDNINGWIVSPFKGEFVPDESSNNILAPKAANSQEYYIQLLTSPFQMGTPINNVLKQIITSVENITGRALTGIGELVANGYSTSKEVLPVNVQAYLNNLEQKLSEVSGPLQNVLQQGYNLILDSEKAVGINPENPIIPIILVLGGSCSLGLLYRQSRFGGYSGDLTPASALDLLKKEGNVVLVDIRSEDLRESEGIPDLRRQARFKAANVGQFKVQSSLQKMLKNTVDAEAAITAAAIKNLKNVQDCPGDPYFASRHIEFTVVLDIDHASMLYWISTADRINKDFFTIHTERPVGTTMRAIRDGARALHTDPDQVLAIATKFHEDLFTAENLTDEILEAREHVWSSIHGRVTDDMRFHLMALFTIDELRDAIHSLAPSSCPGDDGLTRGFFVTH